MFLHSSMMGFGSRGQPKGNVFYIAFLDSIHPLTNHQAAILQPRTLKIQKIRIANMKSKSPQQKPAKSYSNPAIKKKRNPLLVKSPLAPKRFKSSYMHFFLSVRPEVKKELGNDIKVSSTGVVC